MGLMTVSSGNTITKVWENKNQGAAFNAQRIALDLAGAKGVIILFQNGGNNKSVFAPIGIIGVLDMGYCIQPDSTSAFIANRTFSTDEGGVNFNDSYYMWSNASETAMLYNFHNIPTYIYKII